MISDSVLGYLAQILNIETAEDNLALSTHNKILEFQSFPISQTISSLVMWLSLLSLQMKTESMIIQIKTTEQYCPQSWAGLFIYHSLAAVLIA